MKIINKIKEHLFLFIVFLAYGALFILKPNLGVESIKSSGYYIKEMLMIMPVIFILTALLDLWVPKEKITHYLGNESKAKGALLSFVLGSISAGPVYAAFPMCAMLRKKGASIMNIVIILSSWAVIKVPMLINEVKFLGPKFMISRWILTVMAILFFAWIMGKVIKEEDLVLDTTCHKGLNVNQEACIGCGLCTHIYPEVFMLEQKKVSIKTMEQLNMEELDKSIEACPVKAISYVTA